MDDPVEHIPTHQAVTNLLKQTGAPYNFSHSKIYAAWETDEIIGFELWRNIGLAMACVFTVIVILLANLKISMMVFLTVVLTLVDIVGFLHFWDITIDIISCVNIVLAIGLCVDYSVHIGLAFMVAKGSRQERALSAVTSMGPAVFNGGFTTFLALTLCSLSYSHVFITFFKVFLLTVSFGLFHGLVLFPVVLALIGPTSTTGEARAKDHSISRGEEAGDSTHSSTSTAATLPLPGVINIAYIGDGMSEPQKPGGTLRHPPWVEPQWRDVSDIERSSQNL